MQGKNRMQQHPAMSSKDYELRVKDGNIEQFLD